MPLLVPLVAVLVSLLITPGWLSHFDITPKVAILLFGTLLILLHRRANVHNLHKLFLAAVGRWFLALAGLSWIATAAATLFSTHPALSINGSSWRRFGLMTETGVLLFAVLAAAWLASRPANARRFLRVTAVATALAAGYGVAQYFGVDPLLPAKAYQVGEGQFTIVRPPGTLGHADYFGAWLVVMTFFALTLAELESKSVFRAAARTVAALAIIALFLSGTRSAMLGLVAGAIVLVVAARRGRLAIMAAAAVCVAALALFFVSPAGEKLRARLHWSIEDTLGGARLMLWRDSLHMAMDRPLTGYGPETFGAEFPYHESLELASAFPDFYHESPHNMFLDALLGEGLLGLLPLVGLCGLGIYAAARGLRIGSPIAAPLAAALTGMLVAQQFVVFTVPTALFFFLILALLTAYTAGVTEPVRARSDRKVPRWLAGLGVAAVALLLGVYAGRLLIADAALAETQRRIASGDASGAAQAYQDVMRWQSPGSSSDLEYSRAMQTLATHAQPDPVRFVARQQALEASFRAPSTAENQANAWYNLSMLLAANNDREGVERALRNSIAASPNWFKPHWTLAQLLAQNGRRGEAFAEAQAALDRDGGHHPEVAATWRELQQRAP